MQTTIDWLLSGPPFVECRTRLGLLGEHASAKSRDAHRRMVASPEVKALVKELHGWPIGPLTSHKSAGHAIHKLTFLADLGLTGEDPGIEAIARRVMAHVSSEGPFQVMAMVAPAHGGSGKETWSWVLCDAPLLVYALEKLGYGADPAVCSALETLTRLVRENGWPCAVSSELGNWRGPGRKDDPCPFANLAMLKALSASTRRDDPAARRGTEAILSQWAERRNNHAYMFYMGTDFCKPKAPMVWYDIVHALHVLTEFPWTRSDPRLLDMARHLDAWFDESGRITPASVWTAWEGWEFAQKKEPSRWVTLLSQMSLQRVGAQGQST